jgi:hypothetical protein
MRRPHSITITLAATLIASCCVLISLLAWAGDRPGETQGSKQFTQPAPAKQFDLSKLDLTKPPVEPAPPKPPDKVDQPKAKPVVRYRAAELVPEGAEVVVELPDLTRSWRSAGASPLGRLMAADALGPVWSQHIVGRLRNLPATADGTPSGDAIVDLIGRFGALLVGEAVVAVYPPAEGAKGRRLLLVADLEGARRATFLDTMEDLKALAGLSRETSAENLSKGDFEYQRLLAKNGLTATWGFVGNQLVVEFGRVPAKAGTQLYADLVLKAAVSRGDKSLAREEARNEQMAILGKDADCYLRADVKALAGLATTVGEKDAPAAVWLEGVKSVTAALRFESGAVRERIFLSLNMESALGKTLPKSAPTGGLAKFMPLDSCYFAVERLEAAGAVQAFAMARASLPEDLRKKLAERVTNIEKISGLSLEKDILPAFAGEYASAYTFRTAGAGPEIETVMIVQPDDIEKLKKALAGLEKALLGANELKVESYLRAQVHHLELPADPAKEKSKAKAKGEDPFARRLGGGGSAEASDDLAPLGIRLLQLGAYAIQGQCIIMGSSPRAVKMAVRQMDPAQHTSSILDKADFKAARSVLGAPANELSHGYLDLRRVGELLYAVAGASGRFADLPPADRVLEDMTGMVWSLRSEKQGVSVEVVSPVGLLPLTGALLAHGSLEARDAAAAAEQAAQAGKLKAIWRGMELFSTEFGRYPLNLSELFPTYVADGAIFLTPEQEGSEAKPTKAEEVELKTGYRYVSGRAPNSVGTALLVYSGKPTVRGTHWCLLVNGKVFDVPANRLAEMIGTKRPAAGGASATK